MEVVSWSIVLGVLVLLLALYWRKATYWSSHGVPSIPAHKTCWTIISMIIKRNETIWEILDKVYQEHRSRGYIGQYELTMKPSILLCSPEMVKGIMVQHFDHFHDRRVLDLSDKDEHMKEMLTMVNGSHWKSIRSIMTPTFTSGKMRRMFPMVSAKADTMMQHFTRLHDQDKPFVNMKASFSRYIMDVIAACAFGIECNAIENEDEEFSKKATELSQMNARMLARSLAVFCLPKAVLTALDIRLTTPAISFFRDVVIETMKERQESGVKRGDFLDLMLEQREEQLQQDAKTPKYPLKDVTIIAQSILFLLAGHETTSNTLAFAAFQLASHPQLQQRLRQEVEELVEEHGSLTYQAVMEAPYLDACISEALRLHPPAVMTERQCTQDYSLPGTDVMLKKGFMVTIPIWCLQNDPQYWTRPEHFDPERFLPENKQNITSGTYLPFGLGPRNCVGMRFALMEAKLVLAKTVENFELRLHPDHQSIEYSLVAMRPKDDIRLVLSPIH